TRARIVQRFAAESNASARTLYARALADDGDGTKALQALAAATRAFPHDTPLALLEAETLAANGRGDDALRRLQQVVDADDQDARAWFLLGRTSIQQGQPRLAVDDYLLRALVLNTRSGDAAAEAETRNALGIGYDRLGQPEAAIEQYTRAAAIRRTLGDALGLGKTLRNLAVVQAVSGQRDAARTTLNEAEAVLENLHDRASVADLYNDRGVIEEESGNLDAALAAYREALALRQQLGTPNLIAESLDNVGFSSYQLGRFDDAQVYWEQALNQYRQLNDAVRQLSVEQNIALLNIARGNFAAAQSVLKRTLDQAESRQLTEQASVSYVHLAELALLQGRYEELIARASRASQLAMRRGDLRTKAGADLQLIQGDLSLGLADRARAALDAIDRLPLGAEQRAGSELARIELAASERRYRDATNALDAAAKTAAEAHSGALDMQIRLERVRLALATGDRAEAAKQLRSIGQETSRLNEVPLRLQWLELAIADALGNRDGSQAA
ncbi:MAG TPA: tetratricopeptide repeat protein, partial [Dokdonella sp.]